jgi:hypothetical protein
VVSVGQLVIVMSRFLKFAGTAILGLIKHKVLNNSSKKQSKYFQMRKSQILTVFVLLGAYNRIHLLNKQYRGVSRAVWQTGRMFLFVFFFFLLDPDPKYSPTVLDKAPTSISDNRWLFNLFAELRDKLIFASI